MSRVQSVLYRFNLTKIARHRILVGNHKYVNTFFSIQKRARGALFTFRAADPGRRIYFSFYFVGSAARYFFAVAILSFPDNAYEVQQYPDSLCAGRRVLGSKAVAALADYDGAVMIATHDRWLRGRWTGDTVPL